MKDTIAYSINVNRKEKRIVDTDYAQTMNGLLKQINNDSIDVRNVKIMLFDENVFFGEV